MNGGLWEVSKIGVDLCYVVAFQIWNHPDIYYREAKAQDARRVSPVSQGNTARKASD